MGRHTGDYLLGTCFLAAALLLDLSNLASQRGLDPPGQASKRQSHRTFLGIECHNCPSLPTGNHPEV